MLEVCLVTINEKSMHYDCEMLGLEIVFNSLRNNNINVDLIHMEFEMISNDICDAVAKKVLSMKPLVVGFSPYFSNIEVYHEIALKLKEQSKSIKVIIGGGICTFSSEQILKDFPAFDVTTIGEGEITTVELCYALLNKDSLENIYGIAFKKDGNIFKTMAREGIKMNDSPSFERVMLQRNPDVTIARLNSARGCYANCTFCVESQTFKNNESVRWRGKTPDKLVEEIEYIKRAYGIRSFLFTDNSFEDSFDCDKNRLREICSLLIQKKSNIYFHAMVRGENFCNPKDIEDIKLLRKAGMYSVLVGCETGYEPTRKLFGKKCSVTQAKLAIDNFHKEGVVVPIGFITYNPYSSIKELNANIDFLRDVDKSHYWVGYENRLQLFYGAPLLKKITRDGLLTSDFSLSNPYGYRFECPEIEWITNFLFDKNYNTDLIHILNWEIMDFENNFSKYCIRQNVDGGISDLRRKYDEWKKKLGEKYYQYLKKLIYIAETTKSIEEAAVVRENIFSKTSMLIDIAGIKTYKKRFNEVCNNCIL